MNLFEYDSLLSMHIWKFHWNQLQKKKYKIMLISMMQSHQFVVQNQSIDSTNADYLVMNENETNDVPDMLLLLLAKNKVLESM